MSTKPETTDAMTKSRFKTEFIELRKAFIRSADYSQEEQDAAMDVIYLVDDYLDLVEGGN